MGLPETYTVVIEDVQENMHSLSVVSTCVVLRYVSIPQIPKLPCSYTV